jgi:hypothetical protein
MMPFDHPGSFEYGLFGVDRTLRTSLAVAAMRELQDAGVEPDIWKLEGLERRQDCLAVAAIARSYRDWVGIWDTAPGQG